MVKLTNCATKSFEGIEINDDLWMGTGTITHRSANDLRTPQFLMPRTPYQSELKIPFG